MLLPFEDHRCDPRCASGRRCTWQQRVGGFQERRSSWSRVDSGAVRPDSLCGKWACDQRVVVALCSKLAKPVLRLTGGLPDRATEPTLGVRHTVSHIVKVSWRANELEL